MNGKHFEPVFIGLGGSPGPILAEHVGSKAAELARLSALRLPVPPAFVLPTSLCAGVIAGDDAAMKAMRNGVVDGIGWLEAATKHRLGDSRSPLFVSVRSGAERSMPGMLDTVLNVGMNAASVHGLIRLTGNPRMAFDSYRRFIQSYAEVVGGVSPGGFAGLLAQMIGAEGVANEAELDSEALERLVEQFLGMAARLGHAPPFDPSDQIDEAARAVYRSWESARAREYRRLNSLDGLKGTAVTVQAMAFGNSGGDSGAGVAFSRDPATGANELYVDFLADAQGEDVVSGRRSPADAALLKRRMPEVARQLEEGARALEAACGDVQDMEFTVERGRLWFMQTRTAKRTPRAALKIAVDLVEEGVIDRKEALARVADVDLAAARASRFAESATPVREGGRRLSRRRLRACLLHQRAGEGGGGARRARDPDPARHLHRGRRRIRRRPGDSHRRRRPHRPCGGRRPADGQGLPGRMPRARCRRTSGLRDPRRPANPRGRLDRARRRDRRDFARAPRDRRRRDARDRDHPPVEERGGVNAGRAAEATPFGARSLDSKPARRDLEPKDSACAKHVPCDGVDSRPRSERCGQ